MAFTDNSDRPQNAAHVGEPITWGRILVQVTIYRRLRIGRDGHLDQSEAYDLS